MQKLADKMMIVQASGPDYLPFVVRILETGKVAVVATEENHIDLAKVSCDIVIAIEKLAVIPLTGLILPKNSTRRTIFRRE